MKSPKLSSLYLIIIIFLLHSFLVICENECADCDIDEDNHKCKVKQTCIDGGENCACDINKCRPNLYSTPGTCYYCQDLSPSKFYVISGGTCSVKTQASECNKITYENNECVDNCGNGFSLGDYCFKTCYTNLGLIAETISNTCICQNYYVELDINGKKFFKCVDSCPYFHDEITKKCVDKCTGNTKRITNTNGCKEECLDDEFLYTVNIGGETKYYCLESCPDLVNFYYEKKFSEKETVCRDKCEPKHFYKKTNYGYQCSDTCDKTGLIDLKNNIFECKDLDTNPTCPDSFPYKYQNSCFRNCSDTQYLEYFDKKNTYIYDYNGHKVCSENCLETYTYTENGVEKSIEDIKHIDQYNLICVDCQNTAFKFHYGTHCLETCENENNNHPNYIYETGECVFQCGELLKLGNACYEKCPSESDKTFKDSDYNECNTCNIPINPNNLQYGEGYYIKELKDFPSDPASINDGEERPYWNYKDNIICLKSCPKDIEPYQIEGIDTNGRYKFLKNDDNECMFGTSCDSIEGNTYIYSIGEETSDVIICYKSCKDIPENYIHEIGNKCYQDPPSEFTYYYKDQEGVYRYSNVDNQLEKCPSLGLKYLKQNECIKGCNSEEYEIPYITENGVITTLGECIDNPSPAVPSDNCKYFNSIEKICYSSCPYKIVKESSSSEEAVDGRDNCVIKCSSAYPYEYEYEEGEGNKFCLRTCPTEYYEEIEGEKKCVSDCKSIGKFYFDGDGNKKCIDKCEKQINEKPTYYYYNENNECLDTCIGQTNKFALEASSSPQPCIGECPEGNEYYYENEKICLSNCTNGYIAKNNDDKDICVVRCDTSNTNQKYIINENRCSDKCPQDEPFVVQISIGGLNFEKCVSNCENENSNLKFYRYDANDEINKCLVACDSNEKVYGKNCSTECPDGLYDELNICLPKCDNKPYFQKKNDKYYECVDSCTSPNEYISSSKECVASCPLGEQFFGVDKKCKNKCDPLIDGQYYKKIETNSSYSYKCLQNCLDDGDKIVDGTNECVPTCPPNKPYEDIDNKKCYSICLNNPLNPFTYKEENKCLSSCPVAKQNYLEDKICVNGCTGINNIINENDKSCVSKCDINSSFKFLKTESDIKKCTNSCNKYTINNYTCYDGDEEKCPKPFNYVIGKECHDKCLDSKFANPDDEDDPKEYNCQDFCDSDLFYYEDERICLKECNTEDFNIQNTQICVKKCESPYYFYVPKDENSPFQKNTCVLECPNDKPFKDIDNYCKDECEYEGYKYYNPSENICKDKCPDNLKKNEYKCVSTCPSEGKIFTDETNTCQESCSTSSTGYVYYDSEKNCLKKCKDGDFIKDQYECVSSCGDNNFIYNQKCVEICPSNQKYFIDKFEHGETVLDQYCLTDCPLNYPFFHKEEDNGKEYYKCLGTCDDYYITNKDPHIIAKECVTSCQFFVKYNATHKECFDICPNEKKYYVNSESAKECLEYCPSTHPYHTKNSFECLQSCEPNYAVNKENEKECVSKCDINSFWTKETTPDDKEMILCISNCSEVENTRFYTPERECVVNCNQDLFFKGNNGKGICECMGLFYYTDDGKLKCINNNIQKCGEENSDDENSKNYNIQISGSNQCIKNCFGLLSPSEDICYLNGECPEKTVKGIFEGKIKCECISKYYIDSNGKKICLEEGAECPNGYEYFVPEKNQCVQNCNDYEIIFDNKCLNTCPGTMTDTDDGNGKKTCVCDNNWYKESDNKYVCLSSEVKCTDNYPYLIKETKECVKSCNGANYNILFNNECLSSCDSNMERIGTDDENSNSKYSCKCKYIWEENGECTEDNNGKKCTELNAELKFLIKKTNKCVKNCPEKYNYYFNDECFSSLEEAREYGYNLKRDADENSKELKCDGFWKINAEDKIECLEQCNDNEEIEVFSTKQCISNTEKCPYDSPYLFNKKCYSNCPESEGTKPDPSKANECICESLWFIQDDLIHCLDKSIKVCPYKTHKYLIKATNQCVKEKGDCVELSYNKIMNYTCYKECPYRTIGKDNSNDCVCNNTYYWYEYKNREDLRDYKVCGLNNCTEEKPYHINGENECINKCSDRGLLEYGKTCYNGSCPSFTKNNGKNNLCEFSSDSNELQEIVGNISEKITEISLPDGGLVLNNEKASMQVYKLNIKENNKASIMRTNLAYIDFSGCINKIYESNDMDKEKDEIVVVKLDLKSKDKKLVINPIEYQFINAADGRVLDASVCEKNELVVSYPITYMLNNKKLRNLEDGELSEEEKKEILEKFNRGKILNEKNNSIDTFNFNSSIYSDICTPVEIDGKDLVLEDRIEYLYPNYSFCESACTYDYTDFQGERIYCNCSIKTEIDIGRNQEVKIIVFNKKEMDNNQKGPTNLPILKCISKATISGNSGFAFCIVFIVVELGLLLVIIFQGISSLINKMRRKIICNNNKEEENVIDIDINYKNSENDNIKNEKTLKYETNNNTNEYDNNDNGTKRKMKPDGNKTKANPPKNGDGTIEDEDVKNEINVISIKKRKNNNENQKIINEKNNFDTISNEIDNNNNGDNKSDDINKYLQRNGIETRMGLLQSMKREKQLLRTKYKYSLLNDKFDAVTVVLTSVFDKIYLIKILLLPAKYEIISVMFSLYLLCHMLLLTFLTFFYDIKTIKEIRTNEKFPNTSYYLSYGFLANLIVWIIFKLFECLLNNEHKIKRLNNMDNSDKEKINQKFNNYVFKIKRNIIVYLVIQFLLIMFCSFYLITFCGIYIATQKNVFQSYGIAFIEIIIIKIIYGIILGVLRKVSLYKNISIMYNITLLLNQYIS